LLTIPLISIKWTITCNPKKLALEIQVIPWEKCDGVRSY
jgi:hypothetical protein